jgi:hypothetical protein
MPNPLSILSGPFTGLVSAIGDIVGKFVSSPDEKAKLQQALTEASLNAQLQLAQIDLQQFATSAGVVTAEVQSHSWLARNWRPILMLTFTYIIAHQYVLAPVFRLPEVTIPPDMWDLLKIGMGGYVIGRSAEKILPAVVAARKEK